MLENITFMSYVHLDDEREGGQLTAFREILSREVASLTGGSFTIFQDRNDIRWGASWQQRIKESLDSATFFIPIITPSYFESPSCRSELEQFLARENSMDRADLILPIYYITFELLNDPIRQAADPLVKAIAARQLEDWRELRHEPFTAPAVRQRIKRIANDLASALPSVSAAVASTQTLGFTRKDRTGTPRKQSVPRREPPVLIVGDSDKAHFRSLARAVEQATAGMRILVLPGSYHEGVVVDKPVEIIGEGRDRGAVRLEVRGSDAILFAASLGRISNLTIHQVAGEGDYLAVHIAQGRLDLEDCDVTSESLSGVLVRGGADPRLRRNVIHHANNHGVLIVEESQGTFEDNEIMANTMAGVVIRESSTAVLRRNHIHDNNHHGVYMTGESTGAIEDNEIHGNAFPGLAILQGSNPTARRNKIYGGRQHGVYISERALGVLTDNELYDNKYPGLVILQGSDPVVVHNHIHHNRDHGAWIDEQGLGRIEDNEIVDNTNSGVYVVDGGNPRVLRNFIGRNKDKGISVAEHGSGTFEENEVTANKKGGISISGGADPVVSHNRVYGNDLFDIKTDSPKSGRVENNDVRRAGWFRLATSWRGKRTSPD